MLPHSCALGYLNVHKARRKREVICPLKQDARVVLLHKLGSAGKFQDAQSQLGSAETGWDRPGRKLPLEKRGLCFKPPLLSLESGLWRCPCALATAPPNTDFFRPRFAKSFSIRNFQHPECSFWRVTAPRQDWSQQRSRGHGEGLWSPRLPQPPPLQCSRMGT